MSVGLVHVPVVFIMAVHVDVSIGGRAVSDELS